MPRLTHVYDTRLQSRAEAGRRNQSRTLYRSDLDTLATLQKRLQNSGYRDLKAVSCVVSDGAATISGVVPSYYMKQVAQAIASSVASVVSVRNQCEVRRLSLADEEFAPRQVALRHTAAQPPGKSCG